MASERHTVRKRRVALFATCFHDTMWPEVPAATAALLERLGCEVDYPLDQTCCGQMLTNTGYQMCAVPLVKRFWEVFRDYDHVVAPSASCVASIRHQHPMIAARAGIAAPSGSGHPQVHELSEFLVDVLGVTDVGASFPHSVVYHSTCHSMRMLHVGDRPRRLLSAVRGLDLRKLPDADECCGFGGTFAIKNADVSMAMGRDKVDRILETGAEYVVAADNSCLAHLGGIVGRDGAGPRMIHLAEVLAATDGVRHG